MFSRSKLYYLHTLSPLICISCLFSELALCHVAPSALQYSLINNPTTDHQNGKVPTLKSNTGEHLSHEKKTYQVITQKGKSDVIRYLKNIYYNDKNNLKDYSKTEFWYWHEKASRQGDAESQFNLGYMYLYGKGVSHDYTKARYWFELSSNQNDPEAKYFLGLIYHEGKGITENPGKAKKLFQQSCSDNFPPACCYFKNLSE